MSNRWLIVGVIWWFAVTASYAQDHSVFLIGDAGEPKLAEKNFAVLKKQIEAAGEDATIIFLGDNIYPVGLPNENDPAREEMEQKLLRQLEICDNFDGKTVILPGNHDWAQGKKQGWDNVKNQTKFIKKHFDSKKVFFPKYGYPGPEEIKLDDGLYLIVFDMQWMLHKWEKALEDQPLAYHDPLDIIIDINSLLEKHKKDHVILASHHPMYSYGEHGGKFPLKQHIFPLTALNKNLYIPLPVLGSLYPGYRATAGNIQDIPHPEYKRIRNAVEASLKQFPNAIYVAGHEHSLQHIKKDDVNYIVSGSGSKSTYLKENGKHLVFGKSRVGFSRLNYSESPKVEFWAADDESPEGEKIYDATLYDYTTIVDPNDNYPKYHFENDTQSAKASLQYDAGKGKQTWMGGNYRDVWNLDVEAPIFNLSEEKGGLEILKKGGGMQTNSLRMEAPNGKQYVVRSVEKYAYKALPQFLQETFAVGVVQDQISSSHPYSAYVIPPMAEALGIYHTNPKLVYIPDDGAFGTYRPTFAGRLALFEERPKGDWSEAKHFGYSSDIVGSPEVLEELRDDNDNYVDETFMLKNRLFDMVIADWDRHEDQWRWASYDTKKGKMYQAIPRDRDQAMFVNEGVLPKIASRRWAMAKIEGFNETIRWSPGFNFNARFFDRIFLTRPDRDDWTAMIKNVQDSLTDEVIEAAIHLWPENVYAKTGDHTIEMLKARRDDLESYSMEFYESLAKNVNVLGSDKKELVLIKNLDREHVQVVVHKVSKKGKIAQVIYDRTFDSKDTKEVRIYGFDGKDEFKISGSEKSKIKVRLIGGKGKDAISDLTENKAAGNVKVYDKKSSTKLITDAQSFKPRLSDRKGVNDYNKYEFKYDVVMPLVYGEYNRDDGVFVGGGLMYTKHGWRKAPYGSRHLLLADVSVASGAFNIRYQGDFTHVVGQWNLAIEADLKRPEVNNFFGLGNESNYDVSQGIDYYRMRIADNSYKLGLYHRVGNKGEFHLGMQERSVEVEPDAFRFISSSEFDDFETNGFFDDTRRYMGGYMTLELDSRDQKMFPTRGVHWFTEASSNAGLGNNATNYSHFQSDLALYYSFQYPAWVTLASRTGYAHNFGLNSDDEFYNNNSLGGKENLRGFRKTRFYGRTSFYQNLDVRLKLFDFSSILFPGKFGIHGFHDVGRVWADHDSSGKWHRATGGGIWVAPLSKVAVALSYAFSPEEDLISFDFGFFF